MQIKLIRSTEEIPDGYYYEFFPGDDRYYFCNEKSVFIEDDAFELIIDTIQRIVVGFNRYGPTKISGARLRQLAQGLRDYGKLVNQAAAPKDLLVPDHLLESWPEDFQDWPKTRGKMSLMINDLQKWILGVEAQKQLVTIYGL